MDRRSGSAQGIKDIPSEYACLKNMVTPSDHKLEIADQFHQHFINWTPTHGGSSTYESPMLWIPSRSISFATMRIALLAVRFLGPIFSS